MRFKRNEDRPIGEIQTPTDIDLNPPTPNAVRLSKRAGVSVLVVVAIVIALIGYGVFARQQRTFGAKSGEAGKNVTAATEAGKALSAQIPQRMLATKRSDGPQDDKIEGRDVDDLEPEPAMHPTARELDPEPSWRDQRNRPQPVPAVRPVPTAAEMRRDAQLKLESEAMASPTVIRASFAKNNGDVRTTATDRRSTEATAPGASQLTHAGNAVLNELRGIGRASNSQEESDDYSYRRQNMQDRKEEFLKKARTDGAESYLKSTRTAPLSRYEVKAGWDIPAVLEQALNSDLPGETRALVREGVYDTATGNYLLIPQGARLVGMYDSHVAYGQNGLMVAWNRIIFPDGSSVNLEGMAGQDAKGQSGLRYDVDNHYVRLFGFAALTSAFGAAFQLSQSQRGGVLAYPSPAEIAGSAVGRELSQFGAQVTRKNLNIQPTIKVPIGCRFNVRVNRDMLFERPYEPLQ